MGSCSGAWVFYFVPFGFPANFNNFSFTGTGTGAALTGPVTPLWSFTIGGDFYSFDLTSLTSGTVTAGSIDLSGKGVLKVNGFPLINNGPATNATWALRGSGSNFTFTVSSVPDGGSAVALLGIALAGIEVVRRKIKTKVG